MSWSEDARAAWEAPADAEPARTGLEIIVFALAGERCAIESRYAREVNPLKGLTPIPCTPNFVLGVINLRGELCPVVSLRRLLALPVRGLLNASHALVIHDSVMEFAIAVDAVLGMRIVDLVSPEEAAPTREAEYLRGITRDGILVYDAKRILSHPAIVVNETVDG